MKNTKSINQVTNLNEWWWSNMDAGKELRLCNRMNLLHDEDFSRRIYWDLCQSWLSGLPFTESSILLAVNNMKSVLKRSTTAYVFQLILRFLPYSHQRVWHAHPPCMYAYISFTLLSTFANRQDILPRNAWKCKCIQPPPRPLSHHTPVIDDCRIKP